VRAKFAKNSKLPPHIIDEDIAIKVFTKAQVVQQDDKMFETNLKMALSEVRTMMKAESRVVYKGCIVRTFGIVSGYLPSKIRQAVNVYEEMKFVGVIMRYEGGGTLHSRVHKSHLHMGPLDFTLKIKLLTDVARGIAELHTIGIVHGDIKPENVLLSSDEPPEARLADFGLSQIRNNVNTFNSTLAETFHFKGTPLYSAPEMISNPFADNPDEKLATASRKSDMYAFAVLVWEVLSELLPFTGIRNEVMLATRIHQGMRPDLGALPQSCPESIRTMLSSCWSEDRSKRKSGIECWSILKQVYRDLSSTDQSIDVALCFHESDQLLAENMYQLIAQQGLSVSLLRLSEESEIYKTVKRSKHLVALINRLFQQEFAGLDELVRWKEENRLQVSTAVYTEPDSKTWVDGNVVYVFKLHSSEARQYDLSALAAEIKSRELEDRKQSFADCWELLKGVVGDIVKKN
jgi:serine/threonine protein kinase